MAKKRKLTLQQRKRIAEQRNNAKAKRAPEINPDTLGELQTGVICAHFGTEVLISSAELQTRCFFRSNLELAVGDRVHWRENSDGLGVVESCEARSSEIQRPDSYGTLRTVGANISQMIITIAPEPEPHSSLIDRYLVSAELHNIQPLILLNKSDLLEQNALDNLLDRYKKLEYEVLSVSAHMAESLKTLQEKLNEHTSIFVGQSGVGKSSLVKALLPDENIRIGELSEAEIKGRHTTTHSQLYAFPSGGFCIDSPGIREFGLWHASAEQVLSGFKEIHAASGMCKFRDCSHNSEPGCAVKSAVDRGDIHPERFQNYQLIIKQLDDVTIKTQEGIKRK